MLFVGLVQQATSIVLASKIWIEEESFNKLRTNVKYCQIMIKPLNTKWNEWPSMVIWNLNFNFYIKIQSSSLLTLGKIAIHFHAHGTRGPPLSSLQFIVVRLDSWYRSIHYFTNLSYFNTSVVVNGFFLIIQERDFCLEI